jgi:hypothetical protein
VKTYSTYSFRDKDPVIDEARSLTQQVAGTRDSKKFFQVVRAAAIKARLSPSTPVGWFKGKTRRPQSAAIEAYGRALGFKRAWTKI